MKMYKACENEQCINFNKMIRYTNTDNFCIKCGKPLFHVCHKCQCILDNPQDILCIKCLEEDNLKKQERKEAVKSALKQTASYAPQAIGIIASSKVANKITQKIKK